MRQFFAKLANLSSGRAEREMNREMEAHLALIAEDFERNGMTPADAKAAARKAYGGVEQSKELHRETRTFLWVEQCAKDIRYGIQNLRRSPGFAIATIVALALGIAAPAAIFSIINAVLLKPMPFDDPARLMVLTTTTRGDTGEQLTGVAFSPAMFAALGSSDDALECIAAFSDDDLIMNYSGGDVLEQWPSMKMSAAFFSCLHLPMTLGRSFIPEQGLPGGPNVAVISDSLWKERFAGDPKMVGKTIPLNGRPYTIVGVMKDTAGMEEFGGPNTSVYIPLQLDPNAADHGPYFYIFARLRHEVSKEQASERLDAIAASFHRKYPDVLSEKDGFGLITLQEMLIGDVRPLLWILLAAVTGLLLIACANAANLLLARSVSRRREIGVRAAMGAARGRIVRQLLAESMVLAFIAGTLGLCLGFWGIKAMLATGAFDLPRVGNNGVAVYLDMRVVAFSLGISLLTGILFGLLPSMQISRVDLNTVLKDSSGRTGTGFRQSKTRSLLVVSEIGMAVVLLVGSTLLLRSFIALYRVDRGFNAKKVITMRFLLAGPKHSAAGVADTVRTGLQALRGLPGVVAASATSNVPLQGNSSLNFEVVGRALTTARGDQSAGWVTAAPGFFDVFQIPVMRGRAFNNRDTNKGAPVAIINATMARQYWKDGDPLKDRIVIGRGIMSQFDSETPRQIIGIVGDVRDTGLGNEPRPIMYIPQAQIPDAFVKQFMQDDVMSWVVRTQGDPRLAIPEIQKRIRQATGLPVTDARTMEDIVALSTARRKFSVLLMGIFGGAALLMAVIGIYGLMAYSVEQRTQEIGIRLALGADASSVRNMVIQDGMKMAASGVVFGLAVAWMLAQFMESLLFGVTARDPVTFVAVPVMLILTALLAVWLPARRALRIDPVEALRCE